MKITFLAEADPSTDPCAYYRCRLPARGLASLGYEATVQRELTWAPAARRFVAVDVLGHVAPAGDVVVCRRPAGDFAPYIVEAQLAGQLVVVDLDDDAWHIPKTNPASRLPQNTAAGLATLGRNLAAASAVLVSTGGLARVVADHTDSPVIVCPNGVDVVDYMRHVRGPEHDPLRVGWMGSTDWRADDLESIGIELHDALDAAGVDIEFVHLGGGRRSVRQLLPSPWPWPIRETGWVDFRQLPRVLSTLDLLLIPQRLSRFALSRSPTSGLAAAAAGVPSWYTATQPYVDTFGPPPELVDLLASSANRTHTAAAQHAIAKAHAPELVAGAWASAFELLVGVSVGGNGPSPAG